MTLERAIYYQKYIGLSTDDKPVYNEDFTLSLMPGAEFYETDTNDTYVWDGNTWEKKYITSFYDSISRGAYSNIKKWSKIGYNPSMGTAETDMWSAGTAYTFPKANTGGTVYPLGMEVVSGNDADDKGTYIHGNDQGANAIVCDANSVDGLTVLNDASANFAGGTAVVAGDVIILDPYGTTPELGIITTVAATKLTCSGGFSSGVGCVSERPYSVLDYSAFAGAQAVKVDYLDGSYVEHTEIIKLNGTTEVPTVNLNYFRINSFRVIAAGVNAKPTGALSIREIDNAPVFSYITAGFTRARNCQYTVPLGKTLYITGFAAGYGVSGVTKVEYGRIYLKINREPSTGFLTDSLFFMVGEIISSADTIDVGIEIPNMIPAKTDIKVSGVASAAGVAIVTLRGYLVTG